MICAYIFASERYYSLSKYTAIFKGKTVELFAYLKISLIPWWAYLNSRLHVIPCNPQHQIDLLSFSEMTNCKGKTTYSLTHITNCLICIRLQYETTPNQNNPTETTPPKQPQTRTTPNQNSPKPKQPQTKTTPNHNNPMSKQPHPKQPHVKTTPS